MFSKYKKGGYLASFLAVLLCLAVGIVIGINYEKKILTLAYLESLYPIRNSESDYEFIKPLLAYKIPSADD